MDFFKSRQNSTIHTDLVIIRHLQCPSYPFVSHLLAEDPGLSIFSVVAILPDFDGFRPISSKLGYFFRFSRHRPFKRSFSSFVFHLLTENPEPSILGVVAILPDFNEFLPFCQNSTIYTDLAVIQTIQWSFKPFVPHLLAEDTGLSIPSAVTILPDFDGFLPILSKLNYLDRCNRHPATKMSKLTLCLPPAR